MKPNNKRVASRRIAFVYSDRCHPTNESYAKEINAEFFRIKKRPFHFVTGILDALWLSATIEKHEVYLLESPLSILVPTIRRKILRENNIIIYRGIDPLFQKDNPDYLGSSNRVKQAFLKFLVRQLDGVISDTSMVAEDARAYCAPNTQMAWCRSFVKDINQYLKIVPDLESGNIVSMSEYLPPWDVKNVKGLIAIWTMMAKQGTLPGNAFLLGRGTEQFSNPSIGIHALGFADKIKYFKKSTFFVHATKYDAGPITLIEAMASGIIPIITENAGNKDLVMRVSPELVLKEITAENLERLLQMSLKKRRTYSKKCKKIAKECEEVRMKKKFVTTFQELVGKIEQEKR